MWHTWGQSHGTAGLGCWAEDSSEPTVKTQGCSGLPLGGREGWRESHIPPDLSPHTKARGKWIVYRQRWTSAGEGKGKMELSSVMQGSSSERLLCPACAALGHWPEGQGPFWKWTPSFCSRLAWGKVNIPEPGPHPSALMETLHFYQKGFCSHPHLSPTEASGLSTVPHCFHAEAHLQE